MTNFTLTPPSAGLVATNGATRTTFASTEPARQSHKVIWSVTALSERGVLKPWHRDFEVRELAIEWLKGQDCSTARMPGYATWKRELPKLRPLWRVST
jgi:hypothetical protein